MNSATSTFLSDLNLSRRFERTEGRACVEFAEARQRRNPGCGSEWIERDGAVAVFDGVDSPITQSFGLGVFEPLTEDTLDAFEKFFRERGAKTMHEVSPLAGVDALQMLCRRGYRPIELSSVLYQPVTAPPPQDAEGVRVRIVEPAEYGLWSEVSARGWAHEMPELREFLLELGGIQTGRADLICFLAELDGVPGAAGSLTISTEGVALFSGAATVPEMRRRGLQGALLAERMRVAAARGCDLAMMVAMAGSGSQRNAERNAFRIAYTRTKWELA